MTVRFTHGADVLDLPDPALPVEPGEGLSQIVHEAAGGQIYALTRTQARRRPLLHWTRLSGLTDSEFASLRTFVLNTIQEAAEEFTFTDYDGTDYQVRYVPAGNTGIRRARRIEVDLWAVDIQLVVVG